MCLLGVWERTGIWLGSEPAVQLGSLSPWRTWWCREAPGEKAGACACRCLLCLPGVPASRPTRPSLRPSLLRKRKTAGDFDKFTEKWEDKVFWCEECLKCLCVDFSSNAFSHELHEKLKWVLKHFWATIFNRVLLFWNLGVEWERGTLFQGYNAAGTLKTTASWSLPRDFLLGLL